MQISNWKNIIRENKYFFSILTILIIFIAFLITDLVIIIRIPSLFEFSYVKYANERLGIYYSYFTTQTNYLVVLYLFISLIIIKRDLTFKLNYQLLLAITTYITITMLVFWTGIIGNFIKIGFTDYWHMPYSWIKTIVVHLLVPILMILVYIFISSHHELKELKTYHKLYLWLTLIYPVLYLIMVMVRGTIRYNAGFSAETSFPYFFLNYHKYGVGVFIGVVFLILLLCIGLQYFYLWINNVQYRRFVKKKPSEEI
ncbi:hypothetical protein S100390_v1c04690 [Spiroplasma sp. NBRC 100390]|uniref:hypothetical protein n=1 Tax=unclassified Spiroplasma TaxID=2637901 RepID=UPI0008928DBE|nr:MULTISPECIES: hypothetical protein [unclassified Spiroplasma]AOX43812.1 hypothetical protein STU14_v1c04690 [Spiroplasma sp. TU-14]APE13282.1 hypothetical protein S100390_v1c04690 [Spiroplasma sp. NBRC 100390]